MSKNCFFIICVHQRLFYKLQDKWISITKSAMDFLLKSFDFFSNYPGFPPVISLDILREKTSIYSYRSLPENIQKNLSWIPSEIHTLVLIEIKAFPKKKNENFFKVSLRKVSKDCFQKFFWKYIIYLSKVPLDRKSFIVAFEYLPRIPQETFPEIPS